MISALASGTSSISGLLASDDVASTSAILELLGAKRVDDDGLVLITGPDEGLHAASVPLDCGNSGTTMRLLSGLVGGIKGHHELVGDPSLSRRRWIVWRRRSN